MAKDTDKTLAAESGVDQATAARTIAEMQEAFRLQQAEMRKLQETVVAQQTQIGKLTKGQNAQSTLEIVARQCNTCGKDAGPDGRCPNPKHRRARVNEIANGVKHNKHRAFIVRQV